MSINEKKPNPKALNLSGLENSTRKANLGAKVHPHIKLRLAYEAAQLEISLSEHVDTLLHDIEYVKQMEKDKTEILEGKLAFYENEKLLAFFKEHEGKTIKFINANGENMEHIIREPKDIYVVLINSFKLTK